MANQLSAYEQQRLDNIEHNQAVLRSLGLLKEKPPWLPPAPPKKRSRDDDDDDDVDTLKLPREPSRRSDRVSKKPALYEGLTDAYFNKEDEEDDDDTRPRVSTRPLRMQRLRGPSYADQYQQDVPRRRAAKPDERRTTVYIPNLSVNAAPTPRASPLAILAQTAHDHGDIPNAALMQPPPRQEQMIGAKGGTSRTPAHPCPVCGRNTLVRARDRATGWYFLHKHWCKDGVERDMVRVG